MPVTFKFDELSDEQVNDTKTEVFEFLAIGSQEKTINIEQQIIDYLMENYQENKPQCAAALFNIVAQLMMQVFKHPEAGAPVAMTTAIMALAGNAAVLSIDEIGGTAIVH